VQGFHNIGGVNRTPNFSRIGKQRRNTGPVTPHRSSWIRYAATKELDIEGL